MFRGRYAARGGNTARGALIIFALQNVYILANEVFLVSVCMVLTAGARAFIICMCLIAIVD